MDILHCSAVNAQRVRAGVTGSPKGGEVSNPSAVAAAEQYAREALTLVPYWHYLRDILIAQIQSAKTSESGAVR